MQKRGWETAHSRSVTSTNNKVTITVKNEIKPNQTNGHTDAPMSDPDSRRDPDNRRGSNKARNGIGNATHQESRRDQGVMEERGDKGEQRRTVYSSQGGQSPQKERREEVEVARGKREIWVGASCGRIVPWMVELAIEKKREIALNALRQRYVDVCRAVLGWSAPPRDSMARWLFERHTALTVSAGYSRDPLLPSSLHQPVGPSMCREILEDLPVKMKTHLQFVTTDTAEGYLSSLIRASESFLKKAPSASTLSSHHTKRIQDICAAAGRWLAGRPKSKLKGGKRPEEKPDEVLEYIKSTKSMLDGAFQEGCQNAVAGICTDISVFSDALSVYLAKLYDPPEDTQRQAELQWEPKLAPSKEVDQLLSRLRESLQKSLVPSILPPTLTLPRYDEPIEVHFDGQSLPVAAQIFAKLLFLFRHHEKGTERTKQREKVIFASLNSLALSDSIRVEMSSHISAEFRIALWRLLHRYHSLLPREQGGKLEGSGHHLALPRPYFVTINEHLDVEHECFASPFNCNFVTYCSAFPDVDKPFGSVSSFFQFKPISGSFQANPPFSEETMDAMVDRITKLLEESEKIYQSAAKSPSQLSSISGLSFLISLPDWQHPASPPVSRLKQHPFLRTQFVLSGNLHMYTSGVQHIPGQSRSFHPVHDTVWFLLQDTKGSQKWPLSQDTIRHLQQAANCS